MHKTAGLSTATMRNRKSAQACRRQRQLQSENCEMRCFLSTSGHDNNSSESSTLLLACAHCKRSDSLTLFCSNLASCRRFAKIATCAIEQVT